MSVYEKIFILIVGVLVNQLIEYCKYVIKNKKQEKRFFYQVGDFALMLEMSIINNDFAWCDAICNHLKINFDKSKISKQVLDDYLFLCNKYMCLKNDGYKENLLLKEKDLLTIINIKNFYCLKNNKKSDTRSQKY